MIAIVLLAYYGLTLGGHHYSIDGIIIFQAARNWVVNRSLFFQPQFRWGNNQPATSKYGIGLSVGYLPVLVPLHMVNPGLFDLSGDRAAAYNPALLQNQLYLSASFIHLLVGLLTGLGVYWLGLELGLSPGWAAVAALTNGLASPFAAYVRYDFAQPLVGLLLTWAAWLALRARRVLPLWPGLAIGLLLGYALLTRFTVVLAAPWLFGLYLSGRRANATATRAHWIWGTLLAALGLGLAVLLTLVINDLKFGSPLAFGQTFGFDVNSLPEALFGLLLSPGRGLLLFFPLAWLWLWAWPALYRREPAFAIVSLGLCLTLLAIYSTWEAWWGGETWGPRYFVPVLPFLSLGVTLWLEQQQRRAARWPMALGIGLTALSFIISLNGILFNFLDFYGQYWAQHGFTTAANASQEQMLLAASPLFAGWSFSTAPQAYDIYWLRMLAQGSRRGLVVMAVLGFSLVGSFILLISPWLRRLSRPRRTRPAQITQ